MKRNFLALVLLGSSFTAHSETRILLLDGDPAPGGVAGVIDFSLSHPVAIKDDYIAVATQSDDDGFNNKDLLLVTGCPAGWNVVASSGEPLPNTNVINTMRSTAGPAPNSSGKVVFPANSTLASNPNAHRTELVVGDGAGIESLVAGYGDPAPGGNGEFTVNVAQAPAINAVAQVAFSGSLFNTVGGSEDDEGVFRWNPASGTVLEIARKGGSTPNGVGTYTGTNFQSNEVFAPPFISALGRVAFYAAIDGSSFGDNGIFVGDGLVTDTFFRSGDPLPGGVQYGNGSGFDFNENGDLAAVVNWTSTSGSLEGVYRTDGNSVVQIAASGQIAPSGFPFRFFSSPVKQDAQGKSVFGASITSATGVLGGIYSGDGTFISQLALENAAAPEARGNFNLMGRYTISAGGYIAFQARTETVDAIYRQRDGAIEEVISTADSIEGSQITQLELAGQDFGQASGINDKGEVAFSFTLADGRSGIALGGVAPGSGTFIDTDGDSVADACDNCTLVINPEQRDTNGDGFGNACDADLNNDCIVNFGDLGIMKQVFLTPDADADLDGDDIVNFGDLGLMKSGFLLPPGPSGIPNACE